MQATPIDKNIPDLLFSNLMRSVILYVHLYWLKHVEGRLADQMVAIQHDVPTDASPARDLQGALEPGRSHIVFSVL